jgi:hypothetical protein
MRSAIDMGQVLEGCCEAPVAAGQRADESFAEGDHDEATRDMTGQNVLVDGRINGPCGMVGLSWS